MSAPDALYMSRSTTKPEELTEKQWEALWMVSLNTLTVKSVTARGRPMLAWFSPDGTNISSRIENLRGKGCLRTNSNKAARVELTERGADMLDPDKHSFTSKYRNLMPQLKATVHKTTKVETFGVIEITKDDLVQMVRAAGVDMPMDVWIDAEFPLKIQWSSTEIKEDE